MEGQFKGKFALNLAVSGSVLLLPYWTHAKDWELGQVTMDRQYKSWIKG